MANEVVLIIEDEPLIALSLRDWLEAAGFAIAGRVPTIAAALAAIDASNCDAAILDVKLADGPAIPVARKLRERGIPFAAFTGYPAEGLAPEYDGAVVVPKPCQAADIVRAVEKLLASKSETRGDPA